MIDIRKKNKKIYIILFFLILIFSTTIFIMYKYHVEGEKKLPFNITKLVVVSSAKTEDIETNENIYQANIIQKNDIFIAVEKNKNFSKEDAIKKLTFNNFKIVEPGKVGKIKYYRTSLGENKFEYLENYEIKDNIQYLGAKETDLKIEDMTVANQGGIIELSFIISDLGRITYSGDDEIVTDGTLLNKLQLKNQDIKAKVSFDLCMELIGGNIFKTTVVLELPAGDILKDGVCTTEIDVEKLVFKRD